MVKEPKPIGVISNFFDQIGVAAIKLDDVLKLGDTIRIVGGEDTDFEHVVESMQIHHDKIEKAKKGDEVGIKLNGVARKGYKVYKI